MGYIIAICFLLIAGGDAIAANCIIDKDNNVVAKINYAPSLPDLNSRHDAVVACSDDVVIGEADYRNNKVVKHIKTKAENDAMAAEAVEAQMREANKDSAGAKLKELGLTDAEIDALIGR